MPAPGDSGFSRARACFPPGAPIATEIELKLAARRRDLPALRRALVDLAGGAEPVRRKLVATYFDSDDRVLRRHGLVLRVRKERGRFVQTVKSAGPGEGGILGRGEWEDVVAADEPDPRAPHSGRFFAELADRLFPVFRTEVTRLSLPLAPAARSRIEAAIDRGKIRCAEHPRSEPICEIELELKAGPPTALYDVARHLLAVAPVRLEPRSKGERGFRLAAGSPPPPAVHAAPLALDAAESGEETLRRVGHTCVAQVLANEAAALAGEADGIHQMRVALRRFRAILSAFGKWLPARRRAAIDEELRWLAQALGAARNFDVFAGDLLRRPRAAPGDAAGLERLRKAADRRRRAAYAAARRAILSPRYTALLLHLLRWLDGRPGRRRDGGDRLALPIGEIAPILLDRRRRTARRRSRGFAEQSPQQRHKLRIALKKLRYTTELLAGLYDADESQRFTRTLKRLQDELGEANDVRIGREIVADLAPPQRPSPEGEAGRRVLAWHELRLAAAEPKLRSQLRRLHRAKPFWRNGEAPARQA